MDRDLEKLRSDMQKSCMFKGELFVGWRHAEIVCHTPDLPGHHCLATIVSGWFSFDFSLPCAWTCFWEASYTNPSLCQKEFSPLRRSEFKSASFVRWDFRCSSLFAVSLSAVANFTRWDHRRANFWSISCLVETYQRDGMADSTLGESPLPDSLDHNTRATLVAPSENKCGLWWYFFLFRSSGQRMVSTITQDQILWARFNGSTRIIATAVVLPTN